MNDQNRFCLIVVYFGRFNEYFDLWLESCRRNPEIDWLIITDDMRYADSAPSNVRFQEASLENFVQRVEDVLGFAPCIEKPYKLCDFRPAYGHIFAGELQGYDYWGHCDTDLIFGDILASFPEGDLSRYGRIFIRGHLSFYRNDEEMNVLYQTQVYGLDYKEIFTSSRHAAFDEWYGIWAICKNRKIPMLREDPVADLDPDYNGIRLRYSRNYPYQVFAWVDGKVLRYFCRGRKRPVEVEEFNRIHFLKHPKTNPSGIQPGEPFFISYGEFLPFSGPPQSADEILAINDVPIGDRLRGMFRSFVYNAKGYAWALKWHVSRRAFYNIWN